MKMQLQLMKLISKRGLQIGLIVPLSLLFLYTSSYKITHFQEFGMTLYNSILIPEFSIPYLQILLPSIELILFVLLNLNRTVRNSLYFSLFLLILYTVYLVAINNFSLFEGCSCGGIFTSMTYVQHLVINFCFILLNGYILFLNNKHRIV